MNTTSDITTAAATLGRKGGKATTEAKVTAARANGAKGGRPRAAWSKTTYGWKHNASGATLERTNNPNPDRYGDWSLAGAPTVTRRYWWSLAKAKAAVEAASK